jgi:DHA1 family bicyclomycin/chloramphenicol resistance-like MFS transporter
MSPGAPAEPRPVSRPGLRLAFLGLVNAMAAFSTDTHLPALPRMVSALHTTETAGQLSLTTFVIGLAIGQLIIGGIVDARGRRGPMIVGAVLYVVAAAACAAAPSIGTLLAFRVVQGAAAAAGIVGARAMLRDIVTGPRAATMFSRLYLVAGVMPVLAPLVGSGLLRLGGWRTIFVTMAVIGALVLIGTAALPETLAPENRRTGGLRETFDDWRVLVHDRRYVALVLTLALAVAAMFGYLTSAPFVLKDRYGLGPTQFALAFGFGAAGFIVGNLLGGPLAGRAGAPRVVAIGCGGLVVSAGGMVAVQATHAPLAAFLFPVLLLFVSTGMTVPNTMALAVMPHPQRAGSAAALLGVSQFVLAGSIAPIIGAAGAGGWALPVYEVVVASAAALCYAAAGRTGDAVSELPTLRQVAV